MKKQISLILVLIIVALVFSGCRSTDTSSDSYYTESEVLITETFSEIDTPKVTVSAPNEIVVERSEPSQVKKPVEETINDNTIPAPQEETVEKPPIIKKDMTFKSAQEVEAMTEEQMVDYYTNYNFVIPDYYSCDRLNIPYIENERFGASISQISASSVQEAIQEIEEFGFIEDSQSHKITYLGEDKYFYLFRITYSHGTVTYINRYFVYKESAVHYSYNPKSGRHRKINMLDRDSVLDILDLEMSRSLFAPVLFREFEETETEYIYNFYVFRYIHGDWGQYDSLSLVKSFIKINKNTGAYTVNSISSAKSIKSTTIGDPNQLIIK